MEIKFNKDSRSIEINQDEMKELLEKITKILKPINQIPNRNVNMNEHVGEWVPSKDHIYNPSPICYYNENF